MWRKTLIGLCAIAIMMFGAAAAQAAGKKIVGTTVATKGGSVHATVVAPATHCRYVNGRRVCN
jgi:hypothetical protein